MLKSSFVLELTKDLTPCIKKFEEVRFSLLILLLFIELTALFAVAGLEQLLFDEAIVDFVLLASLV